LHYNSEAWLHLPPGIFMMAQRDNSGRQPVWGFRSDENIVGKAFSSGSISANRGASEHFSEGIHEEQQGINLIEWGGSYVVVMSDRA